MSGHPEMISQWPSITADGHGQLHAVMPDLPGVHIGLRRHDVIERRQLEPASGQQEDAEILRVPGTWLTWRVDVGGVCGWWSIC
jgi:hypothetical protein